MLLNQVVAEKKVPDSWQKSTATPIWKKKSTTAEEATVQCAFFLARRFLSSALSVDGRICVFIRYLGSAWTRWAFGLDQMRFGHLLRAKSDTVREAGLNLEVPGKRPRGRPKRCWLDTQRMGLKAD